MKTLDKKLAIVLFIAIVLFTVLSPVLTYAAEAEGAAPKKEDPSDSCGLTNMGACVEAAVNWLAAKVGELLLYISGFIMGLSGLLLEEVVSYTVLTMGAKVKTLEALNIGWRAFRDIANLFFIFILLYIAIGTILRLDSVNTKKLLVHVIIIALLLNFSLFFTKVVIDASNTTAIGFHQGISQAGNGSISMAFAQTLGITSLLDPSKAFSTINTRQGFTNILIVGILGSAFLLTIGFVFFAASLLLIIRFVVLVFLMILSPLAFVAMALPRDEYSKKWWDALFSQAIWVPVFFALLWVTLFILTGLGLNSNLSALIPEDNRPSATAMEGIMKFIIVIGMMVFALVAAKQIGAIGATRMVNWGRRTAGSVAGGIGGAAARQALRGAERPGGTIRRWGAGIEQSKYGKKFGFVRRFGKELQGAGRIAEATSARRLYEKAARSRFIPKAPLEATAGALMRARIGGKSVEEAHQESINLTNYYRSRKSLKRARKEENRLKKMPATQEQRDEAKGKREDAEKEEERAKAKVQRGASYTDPMKKAEEEKEKTAKDTRDLQRAIDGLTEALREKKEEEAKKTAPPAKPQKPGESAPGTTASVPFMITREMKERLKRKEFTEEEINKMTPEEARDALKEESK